VTLHLWDAATPNDGDLGEWYGYDTQFSYDEQRRCMNLKTDEVDAIDRTASITISHHVAGPAIGRWKNIATGSGELSLEITLGASSTHTHEVTNEVSSTITAEMSEECKFGIASETMTVSASVTSSIQETTSTALTYSVGATTSFTCKGADNTQSVGIWQWTTESNDGNFVALSEVMLCRFGADFDQEPPCPIGSCDDDTCDTCVDWHGD